MATGSLPLPIQVVLQGGGAKLCVLMAACDVLRELEADEQIQITRVAGSSAGAIAAAMLASKKTINEFKSRLREIGRDYLSAFDVKPWQGAWRVYRGQPYFSGFDLEKFFERLFAGNESVRSLNQLRFELGVYFTDLYSLESRRAASDEALPRALAKSCRFPLALVGFKSGNTDVDGGLAFNLPVDLLKAEESTRGNVIGIGFVGEFGSPSFSGLLNYTQQLFSAAVQSSVVRSERILGEQNLFSINTRIGTFEFARALNEGLDTDYDLVKAQFRAWMDAWLRRHAPAKAEGSRSGQHLVRPVLSASTLPQAIARELSESLRTDRTHAKWVKVYEAAIMNPDGTFSGKYRATSSMSFVVCKPLHVLQFDFETGKKSSFDATNLGCSVVDSKGRSVQFSTLVQEMPNPGVGRRRYRIYLLFDQQLAPGSSEQPYVQYLEYITGDGYPHLGTADFTVFTRWQGGADEVKMAVAFPRTKLGSSPQIVDLAKLSPAELSRFQYSSDGEVLVTSEELAVTEFVLELGLDQPTDRYFLVGRRAYNLKQGQGIGFGVD